MGKQAVFILDCHTEVNVIPEYYCLLQFQGNNEIRKQFFGEKERNKHNLDFLRFAPDIDKVLQSLVRICEEELETRFENILEEDQIAEATKFEEEVEDILCTFDHKIKIASGEVTEFDKETFMDCQREILRIRKLIETEKSKQEQVLQGFEGDESCCFR